MGGINKLTALAVQKTTKAGYYGDGGGLWLQISKLGGKSWIFRYTRQGKTQDMGLGPSHTVSLLEARAKALQCRKMLMDGRNPLEEKRAQQRNERLKSAKNKTFADCALAYIEAHKPSWKNEKHAKQWAATLENYAFPIMGNLPVEHIDTGLILEILEPIWKDKTETASRLRGRIESVLDWAKVRGYRSTENPARWKGHLDKLLPAKSKVQKVKHHAALPYTELAVFMVELKTCEGFSARALEFSILTATRSGEVRGATWNEIDFQEKMWTIPAERMKAGKEHRIPLSDEAITLLKSLPQVAGNDHLFPSTRAQSQLSDMALMSVLRRMGRGDLTQHGFRSTFRDWAAEVTHYPREVMEHALAHKLKDKVEAAYQRGDLLEKRAALMADWSQYCYGL